jgi:hypothetical protein
MLEFLDNMSKTNNKDVLDLLLAWCLEVFDNYKKMLPKIVDMMPTHLKKMFLEIYSHYLK